MGISLQTPGAVAAALFCAALAGPGATTAGAAEFSADVHSTAPGGQAMDGKLWVKGERMRQEFTMMGQRTVMILDLATGTNTMVDDANRIYFEMQAPDTGYGQLGDGDPLAAMADREELGGEEVSGYDCLKVRYTFHDPQMGTSTQWIARDLDFPVKIVATMPAGETVTQYSNIREGGVDDALLRVPDGYHKMTMPGMGMGMGAPGGGM